MITIGRDGMPKPARAADRVRTKRLRRDPRCALFVFDAASSWLALETQVLDEPSFLERMRVEGRLIDEFDVERAYGTG